ncbi:peptidase domain-containing ABC transporter [Bilifractor sp. LCP21S3_A7]|uniref:peptidase domain-containing ABC transporter n=1 Tax=Bilifractor sp. LCP21S3_A7 TaxID=3438738 RepID=UPI003F90B9BD
MYSDDVLSHILQGYIIVLKKNYKCVRQYDTTDCACACIATIASYFGMKISLAEVRRITEMTEEGASIYELCHAMSKLGLEAEAYIKTGDEIDISQITYPCIALTTDYNGAFHFIVLYGVKNGKLIVADPAQGFLRVNEQIFFEGNRSDKFYYKWEGILVTCEVTARFKEIKQAEANSPEKNNFLKKSILDNKRKIITIILCSIASAIFAVAFSFYFGTVIDSVVPYKLFYTLIYYTAISIQMILLKVLVDWFRVENSLQLGKNISETLFKKYYHCILRWPLSFLESRKSGEILSRIRDVAQIEDACVTSILIIPSDILLIAIVGIILIRKSIKIFILSIIILLAYLIVIESFKKIYDSQNILLRNSDARVTTLLVESIEGAQSLRVNSLENKMMIDGTDCFHLWQQRVFYLGDLENKQAAIKMIINGIGEVALIFIGINEVMNGMLSIGELVTLNILIGFLLSPMKDIVDLQTVYQAAKVSKERLLSLINVKSGEDEGIEICKFNNIRTKNIGFGYNSYSRVLEGCSIEINEGDKLFIKGASGTGKTTFAKILCGLYEPCEGEILLNDVLYKKISSRCIHQMIYYVSDDEYLFSGTIASNIFASNDADVDSLNMLISRLKLDALISRLPHGINSVVTENGKNYSKGERQKIAMARALYAKPEVLIMDEALEGVDSEDSTDIMNFLLNISDLTLVMISHNDSFSQRFDKQININSMGKWLISRN